MQQKKSFSPYWSGTSINYHKQLQLQAATQLTSNPSLRESEINISLEYL